VGLGSFLRARLVRLEFVTGERPRRERKWGRKNEKGTYTSHEGYRPRGYDGPGSGAGDQVEEQGPGSWDLNRVIPVELGKASFHVLYVCNKGMLVEGLFRWAKGVKLTLPCCLLRGKYPQNVY